MKKSIALLSLALLLAPLASVQAAELRSDYVSTMSQDSAHVIAPVYITAQAAGEITAEHGINLILDEQRVLWHEVSITASGTAVTNGKVAATPTVTYLSKHKVLHIPVISNFASGEVLTLTGLTLRTYDREFSNRFMGMDLTGDMVADTTDLNAYNVNASTRTDQIIPYPVTNIQTSLNAALTKATITWSAPDDYDVVGMTVDRTLKRGSSTSTTRMQDNLFSESFEDDMLKEGDEVTYTIFARDRRNEGEAVTVSFKMEVAPEVEEPEVIEEEVAEEPERPAPTGDRGGSEADLKRLFGYYRVRHQIKCMPSGKAAQAGDSACLWAKIDIAYAQAMLERDDVNVGLTQNNLDVIGKRLSFSSQRYEENCVEAAKPASYCAALGKAVARAEYFLGE